MDREITSEERDYEEKPTVNKFRLLIWAVYLIVNIVTIVLSLWQVGFDFDKIVWDTLASDMLINDSIILIMFTVADKDGDLLFRDSPRYPYYHNLKKLLERSWRVMRRGLSFAFSEYCRLQFIKKRKDYFTTILQDNGMHDIRIMDLTYEEIDGLLDKPLLKDMGGVTLGFDTLLPEQVIILKDVKSGKYKYREIPSNWYLEETKTDQADSYRTYANAPKERKRRRRVSFIFRFISAGLISILLAALFRENDVPTIDAVIKMSMRIGTAVVSIISGYISRYNLVKEESDECSYKYHQIDQFFSDYESGVFVPTNLTEKIKERLIVMEKEMSEDMD